MSNEQIREISMLINSIYYFVQCGLILNVPKDKCYRLVVLHNGRVLTDSSYKTVRGAKIAFARMFQDKSWAEGVKPEWSHFYNPDISWLNLRTKEVVDGAEHHVLNG